MKKLILTLLSISLIGCFPTIQKTDMRIPELKIPANAYGSVNNWSCKTGYKKTGNNCIYINVPNNAYAISIGDGWKCKTGYERSGNSCIKSSNKIAVNTDDEFEAEYQAQQARLADGQPKVLPLTDDEFEAEYQAQQARLAEVKTTVVKDKLSTKLPANAHTSAVGDPSYQVKAELAQEAIEREIAEFEAEWAAQQARLAGGNLLTTSIPTKEKLLINTANLGGQEQYKTTSLENLSCKSYIVVTKGGGINVKQVESSTYQKSSKYLQGYTDVTNQRYFELQSRIRQARYELEDVYAGDASGYNNWTALLAGVLTGVRENQVKDKIRALEKELRNTSMTTRKKNIATYNVTGKTVSFEKTQRFKWMSINCINGEVSINEVTDKENSGKTHFFTGIHAEDLGGLSVNTEKSKQNRIKIWSDRPLLSMSDIEGNKSSVLTTSTINTDNISIVSKIKWFLSTQ